MKKNITLLFPGLLILLFVISGCNKTTEEEVFKHIGDAVESAFATDEAEPNENLELFNLYMPDQFNIIEDSPNNLIFAEGNQMYILFYNTFEDEQSELFYLSAKANGSYSLIDTYHNEPEERFGYLKIADREDTYQLEVGIGGVKITTQTSLDQIEEDAVKMMTMINSIEFDS